MTSFLHEAITSDFKLEVQTVQRLCLIVDTPRALTVYLLCKYAEWGQVIDLGIDASAYEDSSTFAGDYLVTEVLRKSPNIPLGIDRKGRALTAFFEAEQQCTSTNNRLAENPHPDWTWRLRKTIDRILGPLSTDVLGEILERSRFGPGASTGVRGVGSVPSDKFDKPLHMTKSLYPFFKSILGEQWWEHQKQTQDIIEGNKFTTVPKNAKTDRGICVEPTLNMFVQLGVGMHMRKALKRRTLVDLNTQLFNQHLAKRAYADGLATIDLAQASDSFSWGLVFHFFPPRWQELIFLLRSEYTKLPDGEYLELSKLSSMGNGFTFEIESLLFYSVVESIVPKDELAQCAVYGDDLIVPVKYAQSVIDALNFLGFRVNGDKSFLAGNFFESCGADYFQGSNVRPFYLRGRKDEIPYRLQIANSLRTYANRIEGGKFCALRYRDLWRWLLKKVPREWRKLRVPPTFGDCGVISSSCESTRLPRPLGGHEGRIVRYRLFKQTNVVLRSFGVLLSSYARLSGAHRDPWYLLPGPPDAHLNPWNLFPEVPDVPRVPFSCGRQPVRGLFGKAVTKQATVSKWPGGWVWAEYA